MLPQMTQHFLRPFYPRLNRILEGQVDMKPKFPEWTMKGLLFSCVHAAEELLSTNLYAMYMTGFCLNPMPLGTTIEGKSKCYRRRKPGHLPGRSLV